MHRMSNKKLAGSRHNKKHRQHKSTVKERTFDPYVEHTPETLYQYLTHNGFGVKPDHEARVHDITECWPLVKVGHTGPLKWTENNY